MQPAVVPQSLIAERRRLGLDRKDEMWEGVLHMNEPGSFEHQRLETRLARVLGPVTDPMDLEVVTDTGIFDPLVAEYTDFRTPDVVVVGRDAVSDRGVEGRATLAVEVRSPGDESYQKLDFYGRVGVRELLIIDRDTKAVRRWVNTGGRLVEQPAGMDGRYRLDVLPVEIWGADGKLLVRTEFGLQEI